MKRLKITLFIILLSVIQTYAYNQESITINVNGKSRNMVVFTPNDLPAKSQIPKRACIS